MRAFSPPPLLALALALLAGAAPPGIAASAPPLAYQSQAAFPDLLDRHLRSMRPAHEFFAAGPVRVESVDGAPEHGEQVVMHWQAGRFREEYRWLGFTEVFGWDGEPPAGRGDHWYGSDLGLPYSLDNGQTPDVTPEYVRCFYYLEPSQLPRLTAAAAEAPLGLGDRYAIMRYAPPGMSEALLLLDPEDYRLGAFLQGNDRELAASSLYKLTTFEDWSNFGACWYPAIVRTVTLDQDGQKLRERVFTTLGVTRAEARPVEAFIRSSTPAVPSPPLPRVPYELPFSFLNDTVVLTCTDPQGNRQRLELDTGANVGLLRGDIAGRLGLTPIGEEEITGHGGIAQVSYVRVEGFKLGGEVELAPWPAAVLRDDPDEHDDRRMEESLAAGGVAGLLGNFLLHNWVVKLDYRRRMLSLYPPGQFDPALHLGPDYYAIPVTRDAMPFAQVDVDGKIQGGAFFNTGAQQFFTLATWAIDNAGIVYPVESVGTGITVHGYTVFGIIRPDRVTLLGEGHGSRALALAAGGTRIEGLAIEQPATHLELLAPGEAPNPSRVASFGNAFFQRFTVTFDLFRNVYYIEGA